MVASTGIYGSHLVDQLTHLQSISPVVQKDSKFVVHDNRLYIDFVYDNLGAVGRHVISRMRHGYSRVDVCSYLHALVNESEEVIEKIRVVDESVYILNNYKTYSTVTSTLHDSMAMAQCLVDSLPTLVILVSTLNNTYPADTIVSECMRSLGSMMADIQRVVHPFYEKVTAIGYKG